MTHHSSASASSATITGITGITGIIPSASTAALPVNTNAAFVYGLGNSNIMTTGTNVAVNGRSSALFPGGNKWVSIGAGGSAGWFQAPAVGINCTSSAISLTDQGGKEIVNMNAAGEVTWAADINIDEAGRSFASSLIMGAELAAGITNNVKCRMRDSVFDDLIDIAKEKGSLTSDDLIYFLKASKIVEKLRGAKE